MSSDVVVVANKSYTIKQSMSDQIRRRRYFLTYNGTEPSTTTALTDDEKKLLKDLGIDSKMTTSLKFYLSTFFDNLHMCSSDSSLILRKDCNIPYYVLWSIMFANKEATDARIRKIKEDQFVSRNIDVAMTNVMLRNMEASTIKDPVDKLFQLILINHPTVRTVDDSLFKLPSNEEEEETEEDTIRRIFTLILTTPENTSAAAPVDALPTPELNSMSSLVTELMELHKKRTLAPLYTFSQHDTTCTSDTLFTILLQADKLGDLFVSNASKLLESDNASSPYHPLKLMLYRYLNMLKLEQSHIASKEPTTKRRLSINKATLMKLGKKALSKIKELEGDTCIGATRSTIMNYLAKLKQSLIEDKTISNENLNFYNCGDFKTIVNTINLNDIKGILVGHLIDKTTSEASGPSGHVVGFVKINNNWYFSNNETGLLHKITDPLLIPLFIYKLHRSNDDSEALFQMEYTLNFIETAPNLMYRFKFPLDGTSYYYPEADPFKGEPIKSPDIIRSRILVITSNDSSRDDILDKAQHLILTPITGTQFIDAMKAPSIHNELTAMGL
jgi:hypothetical protein